MGIQIIPSLGDSLSPAVGQIAGSVSNLINPDLEFQRAIQGAIVRDPSVLKKLAEADVDNPGLLERLGLPALAGGTVPIEKEFERRNREPILAAKKKELDASTAATQYTLEQILDASDLVARDSSIKLDRALQMVTKQNSAERTIQGEAAKQAPLETRTAEMSAQLAEEAFPTQLGITRSISELLKGDPQVSLDAFVNGKFSNMQMAAIASSPLMDALKMQQNAYSDQLRLEIARGNSTSDAMDRLFQSEAFRLARDTRAGTATSALQYVMDPIAPQTGAALEARAKAGETLTPNEQAFLETYQGVQKLQKTKGAGLTLESNKNITSILRGYNEKLKNETSAGERALDVSSLNAALLVRANQTGGPVYTVTEEMIPRTGFDRVGLVFKNSAGVPVSESEALTGSGTIISPEVAPFVQAYNALPNDSLKQQAVKNLIKTLSKSNPKRLAETLRAIGVQK